MLSIIVPVHNEAGNIESLTDELHAALGGRFDDYEIIYVDDGSTDGTLAQLKERRLRDPRLRLLCHDRCHGQSAALRSGVRMASYPWIATLDGDGQNQPSDILLLWDARPPDLRVDEPWLAIGHRVRRNDSWSKRLASRAANRIRAWLLRDGSPDTGCGLKLFSRATFLALPWFDHVHRYLPALVQRAGGRSISVPVGHRARWTGQSKYGVWDRAWVGIWDLIGVRWLLKRNAVPTLEELT